MTTIADGDAISSLEEYAAERQMSLAEAMERYTLVGAQHDPVNGSYVVLADQSKNIPGDLAMAELGYASPSPWTSWTRDERVAELRDKQGLRTYFDMKRADATVRGALRLLKTPIQAARWFIEPYSEAPQDMAIAKFIEKNFFEYLSQPWSRFLEDALLMCEYGYMAFEKVWAEKDGKLVLSKLAPRHPLDIREWQWDDHGGPIAFVMENVTLDMGMPGAAIGGPNLNTFDPQAVTIPIDKALIFTLEQEAGDLRGISILRSAYKHYYYKDTLYKIDAIQKERHGIGVPIIKMPMGFTAKDRALADDLGRNLRTNERAHITIPANWEVAFAKLEGQPVDCMKSIEHHDMKIKSNILAPFMDEANVNPDSLDVYYKATRYIASTVSDTINKYLIPQMVGMNFRNGNPPYMRVRRIGEEEALRTLSFAFRNFVGAGAIRPDDPLEKFLRSELDLPPADEKTARQLPQGNGQIPQDQAPTNNQFGPNTISPQNKNTSTQTNVPGAPRPPRVGGPRQANTPPVHPGKSNTGTDTSGG